MPQRSTCCGRNSLSSTAACVIIICIILLGGSLTPVAMDSVEDTVATQKKLRSLITEATPISGFYGPGDWWAWLITLGMTVTHGHSFLARAEPDAWDYNLMGASGYIVAAAIDLTLKARAIRNLGDSACESPLLPALLCAERVVSLGTGSSLFTIATAGYVGRSSGGRRAAIALIPVVFALIASGTLKPGDISFALGDFPSVVLFVINVIPHLYGSRYYWLLAGSIFTLLAIAIPGRTPLLAGPFLFPFLMIPAAAFLILEFLGIWVLLWALLYILAFSPQMGSFPLIGMSVMDMDQLAVLLGVSFFAAFRSGRRIFKSARDRTTHDTHELRPLLPPV
ncbi:hypothetical protein C8R45DRAFT_1098971 [Mycena sanguinolenta]|nr:hypothetical protein C8R45DRAFT_1098971 [Mycena sanguinolenta]